MISVGLQFGAKRTVFWSSSMRFIGDTAPDNGDLYIFTKYVAEVRGTEDHN